MFPTRLYRAKTLEALDYDLAKEISWLNKISTKHLKNYQIWQHRPTIIDRIGTPDGELEFLSTMLALDAKNYHVWGYRQWMVQRFSLWHDSAELAQIDSFLSEDIRNNSAWNHRWYCVFGRPVSDCDDGVHPLEDKVIVQRELAYALSAVRKAPQNESPWNYIRGLQSRARNDAAFPLSSLREFVNEFVDLDAENPVVKSSHALDVLASICGVDSTTRDGAVRALELLARKYDPVRAGYWRYRLALVNAGVEGRVGA